MTGTSSAPRGERAPRPGATWDTTPALITKRRRPRGAPPTVKQLLNLADRSERGQLSPDEAARLRAGIAALDTARRSGWQRIAELERSRRQINEVRRLVHRARQRGGRVGTLTLAALLGMQPDPQRNVTVE